MDNTIIRQGNFTSAGTNVFIALRNGVDWFEVLNFTQLGADPTPGVAVKWEWQLGMGTSAVKYFKADGANTLEATVVADAVRVVDTSLMVVGVPVALTSIDGDGGAGGSPRVLVGSTAALLDGDIVRLYNVTGGQQLGGIDFSIVVVDGTHFDLVGMPSIADTTGGHYAVVSNRFDFVPNVSVVSEISNAAHAVVVTTTPHGLEVGQTVRFVTNSATGMIQANGLSADVISVTSLVEFVVDLDTSTFGAFVFPLTSVRPFSPALVVPFGEAANANVVNPNSLDDAVRNISEIGIELTGGAGFPAGAAEDVIFWKSGTSFDVSNLAV